MAKFKKGDRVRRIGDDCRGVVKGGVYTISEDIDEGSAVYITEIPGYGFMNSAFKLLTEYTPITPKVGEMYRVLKPLVGWTGLGTAYKCGDIVTIRGIERCRDFTTVNHHWSFSKDNLTTEYLELVEEPRYMKAEFAIEPVFATIKPGQIIKADLKDTSVTPEPIKKTIIQKTMNAFKKALLSADTKTLIKAGYMDSETLELTSKGQDALNFIVYEKYQKELVAAAAADIREEQAKKK